MNFCEIQKIVFFYAKGWFGGILAGEKKEMADKAGEVTLDRV